MKNKKTYESISGGIFLIGLGLLFLVPGIGFWPWILAVIGAAGLPASLASNKGWLGWQGFFWMVGLAVLFATGLFWPGILILIGLSTLVGALTRESAGSPFASDEPDIDPEVDHIWISGSDPDALEEEQAPSFRDESNN